MGISTIGFIATENKDVFKICNKIDDTLRNLAYQKYNEYCNKFRFEIKLLERYQKCNPKWHCQFSTTSFYGSFQYFGERRELSIHFQCDNDYKYIYSGPKVIFSLGAWGSSEEVIKTIGMSLLEFGDFYLIPNDCLEEYTRYASTVDSNARPSRKRKNHASS